MAIIAIEIGIDIATSLIALALRPKVPLPPLRDLEVMTGTNGAPIPFGWGTVRIAGNVIWTSGITYSTLKKKSNAGVNLGPKGSFVFTASVAVAFGEGPASITRIWGDSKLVYDATPTQSNAVPPTDWPAWSNLAIYNPGNQVSYQGQVWQALTININSAPSQTNSNWVIISDYPPWSSTTEYLAGDVVSWTGGLWVAQVASNNGDVGAIAPDSGATVDEDGENVLYWIALTALYNPPTIYPGDENQLQDSLIQASEGATLTPAFRGLAYVVWENFPLTNFGDRIPSFRAELTYTKVSTLV